MRILFVANVPRTRLQGVPRILLCLGDELVAMGHSVDYLFAPDVPRRAVPGPLRPMAFALAVAPRLLAADRRRQFDVVAAHSGSGWAYGALRRGLGGGARYVLLSQGWEDLLWRQFLEEAGRGAAHLSRRHRISYPLVHIGQARAAARLADAVVCCSSEERDHLVGSLHLSPRKVHFVPNGVAPEYLRLEHRYPERASRLLCVAMWNWRKGQRYLLEAYGDLRAPDPGLALSLVGTRLSEETVRASWPGSFPPGVRVVPEVDEAALRREYREHDLLVMPTLFEGMSLVILEAMAAGLPVVATATSGAVDVIEDGVNGLLLPTRDVGALTSALRRLIPDAGLRERMAGAARATAESLTWDRVARKLLAVFEGTA